MTFDSNCMGNETLDELVRDNLLWSISGMVSFSLTFVILLLLVFHKAYTSILQRLFLYFTIVTLLQLACIAMNVELQFDFEAGLSFCKWLGFTQHLVYVMNWLFSLTLTSYLHFLFYHQIRGKQLPTIGRKKGLAIEILLLVIITSLPLTVLLVPFSSYGLNGSLCWTQHLLEDCSENVLAGTFELVYTYCCVVTRLIIVASFLVLFGIFCRLACKYRHTRNQYLKTIGRTVFLMFFLILSASIELIGLLTYIHTAVVSKHSTEVVEKLLQVDYVVLPFSLVIIPTGFMMYLYSLKKFSWESMKRAANGWKWCCLCCDLAYTSMPQVHEDATAPESNRVSAPSQTRFTVPNTDGFNTTVNTQEQASLIRKAPISSGYESIISTAV